MGISVSITAGSDLGASSAVASGSVEQPISDEDRVTFNIGERTLKDAVLAHFGQRPDNAFLYSPTPWGDLYKTYSWPQVKKVMVVEGAEILSITSQPVIVKTQEFTNSSDHKATFKADIMESLTNTALSSWSTGGTFNLEQMIKYEINFLGTGGGGSTTLSYSQEWGIGGANSQAVTVGSSSGVSVELKPGESVIGTLSASRGVMRVLVRYNAYLTGTVAVSYESKFKDHHFWGLPIEEVMASHGLSNSVKSFEEIEIGYYSNAKIELKEAGTGRAIQPRLSGE